MKWYMKSPVLCFSGIALIIIVAAFLSGCASQGPSVIAETESVTKIDLSGIALGNHAAYIPINRNNVTGKQFADILDKFESEKGVHVISWSLNSSGGDMSNGSGNRTIGICVTFEKNP